MSVPNQTPYIIYNANGMTTVFPFEFYVINAGDIQVTVDGTVVTSGFSVSGVGNVGGGDVVFVTPPANGAVVMLERVVPTYRLTDYQDNGDLLADTVNKDFDRLWMAIQRAFIYLGLALRRPLFGGPFDAQGYRIANLGDPVNLQDAATKNYIDNVSLVRTLRVPEVSVSILPPADQRANKLLAFNAEGQPIVVLPASGSASDVMIELAKPDGEKFIGECPTITALRTLEPTYDKQRITLREYTAGSRKGGGQFRAVLSGASYTDNGGTIIKTVGGAAWIRMDAIVLTPAMFGAIGDGITDDTVALQRVQVLSGVVVNFMGLTYYTTADLNFNGTSKSVFTNGTLKPSAAVLNVVRVSNAGHIIDGLNIDGTLATGAIGYSITITATRAQVRNLNISNTGRSAIACSAFDALIYRVNADGCGLLAVSPFVNTFYIIANEGTIVEECRLTRCYNGVYFRTDLTASKTSRNKLINTLLVGNGQTADAGAQGVSSQNNFGLEVSGCYISGFPDNGIDLQQSDYCDIHHNHVVNCKDGVFIGDRSCKGHKIHHNHFEGCVRGFRFYCVSPELSASFYDNSFTDNVIVSPASVGIYVWLPNAVDSGQCTISRNTIRMLNSPAGATHAIMINNLLNSKVNEHNIVGCPQNGIVFTGGATNIIASDNSVNNSSRGSANTYDAVYIDPTANRIQLRNTMCVGGGKYAVNVAGGINHTVTGTRWVAMGTGGVNNAGTGTVLADNVSM
ncbi:phage tail fiber domain-containing protein [Enterobacter soli]|uniref:phage tail fiber domain-containing protein n=1 Tax=Enterobacter soli TaxID=885040 RepID=UPI00402AC9CC